MNHRRCSSSSVCRGVVENMRGQDSPPSVVVRTSVAVGSPPGRHERSGCSVPKRAVTLVRTPVPHTSCGLISPEDGIRAKFDYRSTEPDRRGRAIRATRLHRQSAGRRRRLAGALGVG